MNSTVDHSNEKCYHCGTNYKQHVCYNCGCTDEDYPEPEIKATAYKVYGAKSIQDFFRDFMEKYDTRCHIFNEIYKNFMMDMHLVDLYNKTYYKPI